MTPTAKPSELLPIWLRNLHGYMEHCVSAADEGVEYAVPRAWLDAMTTLGLMEKCGRGRWRPTEAGDQFAAWNRRPPSSEQAGDWVLVPRVATPKMIDATWNHPVDQGEGVIESQNTRNARIYSAMIEAAPAKPCDAEDVATLAATVGLRYAATETCRMGAPFYAFTESELQEFVRLLAQPQLSDEERAEEYRKGWLAGNKNGEAAMAEVFRSQPQRQGRAVAFVDHDLQGRVRLVWASTQAMHFPPPSGTKLYAEQPTSQGQADICDAVLDPNGRCPECKQRLHVEQPASAAVAELPAKWRKWADKVYRAESANRIRDCADDLEAALAAAPGAGS